jgi:hypothetical protein
VRETTNRTIDSFVQNLDIFYPPLEPANILELSAKEIAPPDETQVSLLDQYLVGVNVLKL